MVERNLEMKLNNRTVFAFTRKRPVEIERPFSPQGHGHAAAEPPLGMLGVQYNLRTQPGRVRCLTCGGLSGTYSGKKGENWNPKYIVEFKVFTKQPLKNKMTFAEIVISHLVNVVQHHPNRKAFVEDLQQKHPCNPFSEESANMIHDMGNMEYFEMCETSTKVQRTYRLQLHMWHVPAFLRAVTIPKSEEI